MMRRILVDHARAHASEKRGGAADRLSIEDIQIPLEQCASDLIALDETLEKLVKFDERKAKIVELRFFGGLTDDRDRGSFGRFEPHRTARLENGAALALSRTVGRICDDEKVNGFWILDFGFAPR